jgi:hypothetical protein
MITETIRYLLLQDAELVKLDYAPSEKLDSLRHWLIKDRGGYDFLTLERLRALDPGPHFRSLSFIPISKQQAHLYVVWCHEATARSMM